MGGSSVDIPPDPSFGTRGIPSTRREIDLHGYIETLEHTVNCGCIYQDQRSVSLNI